MDVEVDHPVDQDVLGDLDLRQAAQRYDVTARTLARHIRCGQLPAYKTGGATGGQWRVTEAALQASGYRLRPSAVTVTAPEDPLVASLRRELAQAQRTAAAERRRADELDRRLGHAMLQCGRLRAALATATGRDAPSEAALDRTAARWLMDAVRGNVDAATSGDRRVTT